MAGYHILLCCCFIITYIVLTHSCSLIYKSSSTTWENAASECKKDGGRLVEVTNKHKWESMKKCFNTEQTWIGGYWSETDAGWTWTENNLPVKDPDIIHSDKQDSFRCAYVEVARKEKEYQKDKIIIGNNNNCTTAMPYLCKCKGRENCLKFYEKTTWTEAKKRCDQGNKHLASFPEFEHKSEEEKFEQIKKYKGWENIRADYYWIGLQHKGWRWISGIPMTFSNNLFLQISQTDNQCLLATNTTWMLADCNTIHTFMCEKHTTGNDVTQEWSFYVIIPSIMIGVFLILLIMCVITKKCRYKQHMVKDEDNRLVELPRLNPAPQDQPQTSPRQPFEDDSADNYDNVYDVATNIHQAFAIPTAALCRQIAREVKEEEEGEIDDKAIHQKEKEDENSDYIPMSAPRPIYVNVKN